MGTGARTKLTANKLFGSVDTELTELAFTLPVHAGRAIRDRLLSWTRSVMHRRIEVSPMSGDWLRRHEADRAKRYDG